MAHRRGIIILIILIFSISSNLYSQKVPVSGEGECLIRDNRLIKLYEHEALQMAINNALYKTFGSSVSSNYEKLTEIEMEGRAVLEHSEQRSQYINTFPNGVWREHKKDPEYSTYKDQKNNWWIKCKVEGYAEEVLLSPTTFTVKTLDGIDFIKDETYNFVSGESGFLYFRSGVDGYLIAFYDDFNTVQRCLPYNNINEEYFFINANEDYLFFSPNNTQKNIDPKEVDEIEFYTSKELEYNQFYILFMPKEINLPPLENELILDDGYKSFKTLNRDKFQKWLQNARLKNKEIQLEIIGITIKDNN